LKTLKVIQRKQSATTLSVWKTPATVRKEKVVGDNTTVRKEKDEVVQILATVLAPLDLRLTPKDEADQKEKALNATKAIPPDLKPATANLLTANAVPTATKMVTTHAIAIKGKMMKINPKLKPPTTNPTSTSKWTNMRYCSLNRSSPSTRLTLDNSTFLVGGRQRLTTQQEMQNTRNKRIMRWGSKTQIRTKTQVPIRRDHHRPNKHNGLMKKPHLLWKGKKEESTKRGKPCKQTTVQKH
jgi:hypothetical protein